MGYTSTSKNFDCALNFALTDVKIDQIPVVYKIKFNGQLGLFEMSDLYTAYPGEDEVLIQDGLEYLITNKSLQISMKT